MSDFVNKCKLREGVLQSRTRPHEMKTGRPCGKYRADGSTWDGSEMTQRNDASGIRGGRNLPGDQEERRASPLRS